MEEDVTPDTSPGPDDHVELPGGVTAETVASLDPDAQDATDLEAEE